MSERAARVGIVIVLALLAIAAMQCARVRPALLWEICREACASRGGTAAAVVGSTRVDDKPGCLCAAAEHGGT